MQMAQRKEESSLSSLISLTQAPSNCWWSDQVLLPPASVPYRDFVLISEFSELEGPLPLAVVTEATYIDLNHYTDAVADKSLQEELKKLGLESFDFNSFVLRVVSVDRSTEYDQIDEELKEQSPMTPSTIFEESQAPCLFSIPDDTQVYFTDSEHNFFAFTHHLTLFDINARGYVHPVALSYITRDPDKIVIRFEELMERFNEVSIRMKKGNYSNFTLDLKCRLLDLKHTQSQVHSKSNSRDQSQQQQHHQQQKPALSMQAIQQAIAATELMIDTLESSTSQIDNLTLNNNAIAQNTLTPETKQDATKGIREERSHSIDPPKDYTPKFVDTLYPVAQFERKLRSLAQLCQEPDQPEEAKQNSSHRCSITQKTAAMIPLVFSMIERNLTPSSSSTTTATITPTSNLRPTFVNTITHDMYAETIKYIQDMTHCLGKNSVVLDMNEEDELFLDPKSSALTFGHTFMLNMDNPQPREKEEQNAPASPNNDEKERPVEEKDVKDNCASASIKDRPILQNDDEASFYPILFAPTQLWDSENCHAKKTHLLEVLGRYHSLIVDVIFSLLIGRTVIIQGSEKNKSLVKQVVQALSVFVPGQSQERNQIIEWFGTTKLTDAQIKGIKLVGVDKKCMDPSIHVDSSCVLDIDIGNGSLHSSPVYVEGQWINQLLDRMMLFTSDESYLAYLHTVFMTMSLKAFVYHHLYVCDEFKLDESSPALTPSHSRGYTSETNSESSTLSRKWSVRLMNYLKKHEDQEDNSTVLHSVTSSTVPSVEVSEDKDYSEQNQVTVTLHSLGSNNNSINNLINNNNNNNKNKPSAIMDLFRQDGPPTTAATTTNGVRRESITYSGTGRRESCNSDSSNSTSRGSISSSDVDDSALNQSVMEDASFLDFNSDSDANSSDSSEGKLKIPKKQKRGREKHRLGNPSDVGPDGVTLTERRGRRYLQDKLKVYGDDQTIVVYLATCVL